MKIAFIFIIKDGEEYLERNLNTIYKFNQDIYAVENNSTDNTKNILRKANLKKVITLDLDNTDAVELCKKNEKVTCPKRLRRLAYIRQQGLDAVMNSGIEYDYICMLDLDFVSFDYNGLVNMFTYMENNKKVDAMFGMSKIKNSKIPYDHGPIEPWYKVVPIFSGIKRHVNVTSAFSGFGIYRSSSVKNTGAQYDYKTITDIEHIHFNSYFDEIVVDTHFNPIYEARPFKIKRDILELISNRNIQIHCILCIIMFIIFYKKCKVN